MKPKNVLILCSDEHARSALGCYGHEVVRTPTLDKLAGLGCRFTRAYTPSPICVPTRACLATGTHVHENRCWSSAEPYHGQVESWMHRLRERDHAVVSVGKLHFRSSDDDNGFSEEILPMHLTDGGRGWTRGLIRDPLPDFESTAELARDVGPGDSDYTEYDRRVTEEACRWLARYPRRVRNKPWVLFVSFVSPHYPLIAPKRFYDLYERQPIPEPIDRREQDHPVLKEMQRFWRYDEHFDEETRRKARRAYYGLCSFLDDNCRKVLAALEESGAGRDTAVIYVSDHGEMLGDHGFWTKSVMFEGSAGVPLIMAGPEIETPANDTLVSLIDIAATVEHLAGAEPQAPEEPWQGRSLLDVIDTPDPQRFILSEYHDGGSPTGFFMIREDKWKYVYYAGDYPPQLFDLETDPFELRDRGEDRRCEAVRERLHGRLSDILDPADVNARAFADQAALVEKYGGRDKVLAMPTFNHTPVGG